MERQWVLQKPCVREAFRCEMQSFLRYSEMNRSQVLASWLGLLQRVHESWTPKGTVRAREGFTQCPAMSKVGKLD